MSVGLEAAALAGLMLAAFAGATVQVSTGFGFAILAAPFFLAIMGSLAAIQVLTVLNVALALLLLPGLWRHARGRHFAPLAIGSVVGVPLGFWLFLRLDITAVRVAVGLVTAGLALLLLVHELLPAGRAGPRVGSGARWPALGVGLASGAMGSALAMPGPPLMLFVSGLRMPKDEARALSLTLVALSYALASALHGSLGAMTGATWRLVLILIPPVLLGLWAGRILTRHLSEARFRLAVLVILLLTGVSAMVSAALAP